MRKSSKFPFPLLTKINISDGSKNSRTHPPKAKSISSLEIIPTRKKVIVAQADSLWYFFTYQDRVWQLPLCPLWWNQESFRPQTKVFWLTWIMVPNLHPPGCRHRISYQRSKNWRYSTLKYFHQRWWTSKSGKRVFLAIRRRQLLQNLLWKISNISW